MFKHNTSVLDVHVPGNFYPFVMALAAGMGLVHGQTLRKLVTCGQLPSVVAKGEGKAQGKSSTLKAVTAVCGGGENKLSYTLHPQRIKMIASTTTETLFFDDVKADTFLVKNSEEFDGGETHHNEQGSFASKAERFIAVI